MARDLSRRMHGTGQLRGTRASSPNDIPSLAELAAEARIGSARRGMARRPDEAKV